MFDEVKKYSFLVLKYLNLLVLKEFLNVYYCKINMCYSGMGYLWIFVCIKVYYY